jgi:hypothetical protein
MQTEAPSMLRPALISGVAFGIAGAIPIIDLINCACCALIIGCGLVAAYLQSQQCKTAGVEFLAGSGAQVGVVAGLVYGVVTSVVSALFTAVLGFGDWSEIIEQVDEYGSLDPEVMDQVSRFMESTGPSVFLLFGLFLSLLLGAIFGGVGGLIGGSLFKYQPTDTTPQAETPPPPPVQPGV